MALGSAWPKPSGHELSTAVETNLRAELARLERPLASAGFLVGAVRVVDEGAWGRLDATVEGTDSAGKIQIHLNKKGQFSIVPQGVAATAIADAVGASVANPSGRDRSIPASMSAPRQIASVPGRNGEFVVDCSKFGQRLIGPTEWRGMLYDKGAWREVFHSPRYDRGHNNLGEYLAIVDACQRVERDEVSCTSLWSDSKTALSWFTKRNVKTTIDVDAECDPAFAARVVQAKEWVVSSDRTRWGALLNWWEVSARGENPADFGRK